VKDEFFWIYDFVLEGARDEKVCGFLSEAWRERNFVGFCCKKFGE